MYNNDMSVRIFGTALYISVFSTEYLLSTSSTFVSLCTLDGYSRMIELFHMLRPFVHVWSNWLPGLANSSPSRLEKSTFVLSVACRSRVEL